MSTHTRNDHHLGTLHVTNVEELSTAEGLRFARRQHGLSQVDLADLLRISQSNISRWENGYESIPRRMSIAMVDVFSQSKERVHPFLRRLVQSDWRISILQFEKNGFLLDSRILHLSKNLSHYFNISDDESNRALSSHLFDPTWRPAIYGSRQDDSRVAIEFERDCVPLTERSAPRSCRLRSQQYVVDCEGYAQVVLSISSILGPGTGEPPRVHSLVQIGDLPVLPPSKGVVQKVRKKISTPTTLPMMQYAFSMGAPVKV
jgi:transcriptional regulator with XRE-family HTH domain